MGQIESLQRDSDSRAVHSACRKNGAENSAVLNHSPICGRKIISVCCKVWFTRTRLTKGNLSVVKPIWDLPGIGKGHLAFTSASKGNYLYPCSIITGTLARTHLWAYPLCGYG